MSSIRSLFGCLVGLSLGFAAETSAQLVFSTENLEHEAPAHEEHYRAEFPFVNQGNTTVTIGQIRSTCGCTVPELEQKVYEPGESGVVAALFTYGERTGRQQKTITVETDAGVHRLSLTVNIPEKWTVEPRIHAWRMNSEPETKRITVTFHAVRPTNVLLGNFPEERFEAQPEWNAESNTFLVDFTPTDLTTPGIFRAHLQVIEENTSSEIVLFLRVN